MFNRSTPFKLATALALTAAGTQPVTAQAISVAERAQRLARIEENLASPDPNLRMAALEAALTSGTIGEKQRAMAIAMASTDGALKSVALRYRWCANRTSTIQLADGFINSNVFPILTGLLTLDMVRCSVESGEFSFSIKSTRRGIVMGSGSVSGLKIDLAFDDTDNRTVCEASFALGTDQALGGKFACRNGGARFGPVAAVIR